jgi:zinc ribbon protein
LWLLTRPSVMPGPIVDARCSEPCVAIEEVNGRSCVVYAERDRRIARDGQTRETPRTQSPHLVDSRLTANTKPFQDAPLERKRHRARHARPELGGDASVSGNRREISLAVTRESPRAALTACFTKSSIRWGPFPGGGDWAGRPTVAERFRCNIEGLAAFPAGAYASHVLACPNCGWENPEDSRFCSACGAALEVGPG